MKKALRHLISGLFLALTAITFFSCGHEPVFYGIMHDVKPEEATINGNITTIARCSINSEEYLILSNGGSLLYKPLSSSKHGEWKSESIAFPFAFHHYNYFESKTEGEGHQGQQILKVIADSTNLYLLTADFEQDNDYGVVLPKTIYFWTCPLNSLLSNSADIWTNIAKDSDLFPTSFDSSTSQLQMDFSLFFTNSPKTEHRKAFLSVTTGEGESEVVSYYLLNGASAPSAYDCSNYIQIYEGSKNINSAFYIGDTLYFTDSLAVATNETAQNDASQACIASTVAKDKKFDLYYYDGTDKTVLLQFDSPIASLAFTADSLIVGKGSYTGTLTSNGGIDRILLDENGKPLSETADFDNNAKYQFTSAYIIMAILCADPAQKEADSNMYATISYRGSSNSSGSSKNVGLWSYYPSRGNWNRE